MPDKREREPPDTTAKPECKSLKTAGSPSTDQQSTSEHGTHADVKPDDSRQGRADRRVVQTREEAKEQVLEMHHRTPAWKAKLPECIKALKNAQPIDSEQVAKVIEIRFANAELAEVAAKALAGLMQAYADEAASTTAADSKDGDKDMQDAPTNKSKDEKTPEAACPNTSEGDTEMSTPDQVTSLGNTPQRRRLLSTHHHKKEADATASSNPTSAAHPPAATSSTSVAADTTHLSGEGA